MITLNEKKSLKKISGIDKQKEFIKMVDIISNNTYDLSEVIGRFNHSEATMKIIHFSTQNIHWRNSSIKRKENSFLHILDSKTP